ncbi:MAG: class II fumarate hydratase [Cyanobacteria bacterium REEB67]|nr:class II fumarate hydratase [Cyanobacteria bacterium REEB67]
MTSNHSFRVERDSMGEVLVANHCYWGASTQRAIANFPVSSLRFNRAFIRALALIKLAAATVNLKQGILPPHIAKAIIQASREAAEGRFDQHFVVDIFQTGSGTSTNMNANEVIAVRCRELLGKSIISGAGSATEKAIVHPNDHVNYGQSSNDVIPTAMHVAALSEINTRLLPALEKLSSSLGRKARQFRTVIKTGRTHLQDATPVTLGQEFSGYKAQINAARRACKAASNRLSKVALGGTAVGTGINTEQGFAAETLTVLSGELGFSVREADNHFAAQASIDDVVAVSATLKSLAIALTKIGNDLRWMASGPRAGLGEIVLPDLQPGSSIMPGKVNPVALESLLMVCARVIGNDATIAMAGASGNFELNVMLPVSAFALLESIEILASSIANLSEKCIDGLTATATGPALVARSIALCTALAPVIGYDLAAKIAKEAGTTGETIYDVARRQSALTLSDAELKRILNPIVMTRPAKKPR